MFGLRSWRKVCTFYREGTLLELMTSLNIQLAIMELWSPHNRKWRSVFIVFVWCRLRVLLPSPLTWAAQLHLWPQRRWEATSPERNDTSWKEEDRSIIPQNGLETRVNSRTTKQTKTTSLSFFPFCVFVLWWIALQCYTLSLSDENVHDLIWEEWGKEAHRGHLLGFIQAPASWQGIVFSLVWTNPQSFKSFSLM